MAQTIKLKRSATQGAVPSTSALALGEIAINTYDGKLFIKKNDGSEAIVTIGSLENNAVTSAKIAANAVTSSEVAANAIGSSEIAANSVGISELNVSDGSTGQVLTTDGSGNLSFSAKTSTAQSFYLNTATGDGNSTDFTLSTTPAAESYIIAFVDGVFQNQDSYTFSGTTLTFDTAPPNGSTVTVYVVGSIYSGNSVVLDTFSGDDLETAFTLSENPQSENNTQVYIDGVYQQKSEYSVSGQTLTFSSAPPTGTNNIEVIAFTSTNFSVLNANSVTSASIASGAVNTSDIADNAITSAKIASGVIVASDVADNSITSAKIAANSVGTSELNLSEGSAGQVLTTDGSGTITFEDVLVKSEAVNQTGSDIAKGTPVYQVGSSGNAISVAPADADDSNKMPAIGVTLDALTASGGTGEVAHIGFVKGINTSSYTAGDTLYISTSGGFTTTAPTGETALLQNMARVIKVDASNGSIVVMGAGRTNAVPNLDEDQFFLGNASNQAVATDFSDAVEALSINNVVEDTTPQLGGDLASNGNDILFADSDKAIFGTGSDLQIFHDGSNSYIDETGDGVLFIKSSAGVYLNGKTTDEPLARFIENGAVNLYYDNSLKFNTSSAGINVTGEVLADSLDIDGNGDISGNLILGGYLAGPSTFTIDPAAVGDNTGTVVIAGNLQVDGTTTTINSTTLTVDDKLVTLASGAINAAAADGAGIEVDITGSTNPSLTYDGTNDVFDFNKGLTTTGSVSVGTSSPNASYRQEIAIGTSGLGGLYISSPNDAAVVDDHINISALRGSTDAYNFLNFTNVAGTVFKIQGDSKVGIGTASPIYSLDVRGEAGIELFDGTTSGNVLNFRPSLGDANKYNMSISAYDHSGNGTSPADGLSINGYDGVSIATGSSTARQERMRIDSSGNVGIGTSSPNNLLTLEDGDLQIHETSTSDPLVQLSVGGTQASPTQSWVLRVDNSDSDKFQLLDQTDSRVVLTADGSGNVGIGQTSPAYNLDVYTTAAAYAAKIKNFNGTDAGGGLWIDTRWNTAGNRPLKITSNNEGTSLLEVTGTGLVGIGTSSPSYLLDVAGSAATNALTVRTGAIRLESLDTSVAGGQSIGDIEFYSNDSSTGGTGVQAKISVVDETTFGIGYGFAFLTGSSASPTEKMRINREGKVGIGTTGPSYFLDVVGDAAFLNQDILIDSQSGYKELRHTQTGENFAISSPESLYFLIDSNNDQTSRSIIFGHNNTIPGSATELMRIGEDGNVGIGTSTAPGANGGGLAIYRSDYPRITLRNSTSGDTTSDGFQAALVGSDMQWDLAESGNQKFFIGGGEYMRLNSLGQLCIGDATYFPTTGTNVFYMRKDSTSTQFLSHYNLQGGLVSRYYGDYGNDGTIAELQIKVGDDGNEAKIQTWSNSVLKFGTNNTYAMEVGTNQSLYVGGTQQGADINDGRIFAYINSTSVPACRFAQGSTSTGIPVMRVRHENSSNGNYIEFRTDENVLTGQIYDSNGTMQYTSQSDQRLKENVEPMPEGLTEVLAMNPVKYTLKDIVTENKTIPMDGAENRGFLAQELNEQYPWAVQEGGEDVNMNPWGVDYGKLTPILVKAIQELNTKLEAAEARITELEG